MTTVEYNRRLSEIIELCRANKIRPLEFQRIRKALQADFKKQVQNDG